METPQTIEAVGSDLEDAITRGLEALNAARSEVDVLVLETNPRATRVRLTIKDGHSQPISSDDVKIAERVVAELLNNMKLPAHVSAQSAAALDTQDEQRGPTITVDVQGENLGSLIGRKGETLDNLQYIARLLVAKAVGRYVNVVIDVEGYKSHRAEVLKQLAMNIAERVVNSRKPMSLEPMPANERRIVHLSLRDHPGVRTESAGLGERRKVTIFPKSMKR
jgi:spoIIIJ-associated protein